MGKKAAIIFAAFLILVTFETVHGEDGKISGEISLTGLIKDGKDNDAKLTEYRDIRNGVYGGIDLQYQKDRDHLTFEAKDIGYHTQSYRLEGGRWDSYRLDFKYDEIPHNYTFDAKTPYSGVGSSNLAYSTHPPSTNSDTWSPFDYSVKRRNMDGSFKLDLFKPLYLDVSVNQQKKTGIYPLGVAGTTPGGISIELPTNIDYTTNNIKVAVGYSTKPLSLSVNYLYSQFNNGDGVQNFRNPATVNTAATTDTLFLAPNNSYHKINIQGGVKLPLQSKFNVDLSSSRAESSTLLGTSYVTNTTVAASNIGVQGRTGIGLSSPYFDGKVNTDNYNFILTSNPFSFFNGKLFYKYYNKSDISSQITTTDGTNILLNDLFGYRKNTYGLEMGFKLPANFGLTTAYNYIKTERQRDDLPKNRDNIFDIGLKWKGFSFMAVKVGYEYLNRAAEFAIAENPVVDLEPYIRRYDAAPRERDTYKAAMEFFPLDSLSFNIGYRHKKTRYTDTILGLTDSKADQFNLDVDWQAHKRLRFFGYFDFEQLVYNQFQRQTNGVALDPATTPTAVNFNWTSSQTENTYGYGLGADIALIPEKLTLKLVHNSVKSDGSVDYTYLLGAVPLPTGRTQDNIDLNARDSYRLTSYVAKATYQMTKALAISATYAYEEYAYDDSQFNSYQYYMSVTQGAYLTGAYKDPSYRTNIGLISVNVKF